MFKRIVSTLEAVGGDSVNITWVALVALGTRKAGDMFKVTTANPDDGIVYGVIDLESPNTFNYRHPNSSIQIITIK